MVLVFLTTPSTSKASDNAEWEKMVEVYEDFKTHYNQDISGYTQPNACMHWVNTAYLLSEFYRLRGDVAANLAQRKMDLIHTNTWNKQAGRDGWAEWGEMRLEEIDDLLLQLWHMTNYAFTCRRNVSITSSVVCLASH